MAICPSCGKELSGEFRFCPFCGAAQNEQPAAAAREERKVVSVLFCDLVGFTASSDTADPEDVRARIRPYHARLRQEIERYGGTVEKFIGDAVMAVFGAPTAHEDDAERAIRAGLRILDAIADLNEQDRSLSLQVRIGINTGEAVVALDARPEEGEGFVTGDVVNTASRLQGAAPVNGIAVSEQTYRTTERLFEYQPLELVALKGKAEPLAIWRPLAPRARFGSDVTRTHTTPLIGRDLERQLLVGTFERSAQQRTCQLVTVVGEPGVGKSRLCAELFHHIDEHPQLITWRQGRCLPYGEGIAFWALGEIVKAECGILESDSPLEAGAKLERALPEGDRDLPWLKARLAPLVGAGGEPASQEESFTAWRRFLESLAAQGPTVLVFEDLHWADEALLAFVEHLADWAEGVALLLVCTARPELYERHPTWAVGLRNATAINLAPLTEEETAHLLSALLERAVLPAETQRALLERAGGNPLYAEEFVRLLADRGEIAESEEVPDSVQALIAGRLDTLTPERKSLLQDAAVIGKVFWAGALAEMGARDPREVEQALHELSRKELVRPSRTSSMEGETEYGFWHLLVRDVCYAQIPRGTRSTRHLAAAGWIERRAGERAEDLADVLAHHYLTALELARAAGNRGEAEDLERSAIRYLALAGERALPLDVGRAEQNLAKAVEFAPAGHPERAFLLERWAEAARQQGRLKEARAGLEEALTIHRERGEPVAAGRVLTALAFALRLLGDRRGEEAIAEAVELLETQPAGPELVTAYTELASRRYVGAAFESAIAAAERALALGEELALPKPPRALGTRGGVRAVRGDPKGLEDLRRAVQLAVDQGKGRDAAVLHNNLALAVWEYEGPAAAVAACREGIDFCERRGITEWALAIASLSTTFLAELGEPELALAEASAAAERLHAAGNVIFTESRSVVMRLLVERGDHEHAPAGEEVVEAARGSGEAQLCALTFPAAARLALAHGNARRTMELLLELGQVPNIRRDPYYASVLPDVLRMTLALEDREVAAGLIEGVEPRTPLIEHALCACRAQLAEAAGEYARAAALHADSVRRWGDFGNVPEWAYALLGQGRCLTALNDAGATTPLGEARRLFSSLGYKPSLAQTDALLGEGEAAAVGGEI